METGMHLKIEGEDLGFSVHRWGRRGKGGVAMVRRWMGKREQVKCRPKRKSERRGENREGDREGAREGGLVGGRWGRGRMEAQTWGGAPGSGATQRSPVWGRGVGSSPLPSAAVHTCWCGSGGVDPCDDKRTAGSRSRWCPGSLAPRWGRCPPREGVPEAGRAPRGLETSRTKWWPMSRRTWLETAWLWAPSLAPGCFRACPFPHSNLSAAAAAAEPGCAHSSSRAGWAPRPDSAQGMPAAPRG